MNDKKLINATLWFFALCVGVILITSCNPYVNTTPIPTARPTATEAARMKPVMIPSPISVSCTVNAGSLYLRSGAGMSYAVTRILHDGEQLAVIERGAWLKVETSQHVKGWVYGRYCK